MPNTVLLEMQYKSIRVNLHHFIGEMMQMESRMMSDQDSIRKSGRSRSPGPVLKSIIRSQAGCGSYMYFLQKGTIMHPMALPISTSTMNTSASSVNTPAEQK